MAYNYTTNTRSDLTSNLHYIGARYVPAWYEDSNEGNYQWDSDTAYPALIIVKYSVTDSDDIEEPHYYISKKPVPNTVGAPPENATYWADLGVSSEYLNNRINKVIEDAEKEAETRQAQINEVNSKVDAEIADREDGDKQLQTNIDGLESTMNEKFTSVQSVIDALGDTYMKKSNPTGTGSLSINRKAYTAVGLYSTTEGGSNEATAKFTHAEGYVNKASAEAAHAEGQGNVARGGAAHAEGGDTEAAGAWSHAQNHCTKAITWAETALGEYNVAQHTALMRGTYALELGNGTSDTARSNALAIEWTGTARLAGDVYTGCEADSSGGKKLATEELANEKVQDITLTNENGVYTLSKNINGTVSEVGTFEIPEDNNAVVEVKDTVVETTEGNYQHDFHTVKETLSDGTEQDVETFRVARKQLTGVDFTDNTLTLYWIDQTGNETTQTISLA